MVVPGYSLIDQLQSLLGLGSRLGSWQQGVPQSVPLDVQRYMQAAPAYEEGVGYPGSTGTGTSGTQVYPHAYAGADTEAAAAESSPSDMPLWEQMSRYIAGRQVNEPRGEQSLYGPEYAPARIGPGWQPGTPPPVKKR